MARTKKASSFTVRRELPIIIIKYSQAKAGKGSWREHLDVSVTPRHIMFDRMKKRSSWMARSCNTNSDLRTPGFKGQSLLSSFYLPDPFTSLKKQKQKQQPLPFFNCVSFDSNSLFRAVPRLNKAGHPVRRQCEPVWPRLVSGRTSVRYRFGSPFSSERLWFVDTVLWLCPSLPTETLKWLPSLPILMQESFWWWQCSDRYIISLSPYLHTPFPPSSRP